MGDEDRGVEGELPRVEAAQDLRDRAGLGAGSTTYKLGPLSQLLHFCASVSRLYRGDEGTYLMGLL